MYSNSRVVRESKRRHNNDVIKLINSTKVENGGKEGASEFCYRGCDENNHFSQLRQELQFEIKCLNSLLYSKGLISDEVRIAHDIDKTMSSVSRRLNNNAVTKTTFGDFYKALSEIPSKGHLKSMLKKSLRECVDDHSTMFRSTGPLSTTAIEPHMTVVPDHLLATVPSTSDGKETDLHVQTSDLREQLAYFKQRLEECEKDKEEKLALKDQQLKSQTRWFQHTLQEKDAELKGIQKPASVTEEKFKKYLNICHRKIVEKEEDLDNERVKNQQFQAELNFYRQRESRKHNTGHYHIGSQSRNASMCPYDKKIAHHRRRARKHL